MKNIVFVILSVFMLLPQATGSQEVLKEKVEVVNVEVPVRVFRDGVPVGGLSRDDFRLIEGKELQTINGFYVRKKKMNVRNINLQAGSTAPPSRYFVLVFRVFEYNKQMEKGVSYIFDHILAENDKLLVLINDRTLLLNQNVWQVKRREILDQLLNEEAVKSRQRLEHFFLTVQKDLDQTKLRMLLERDSSFYAPRIIDFLERYLRTWNEFKTKYLIPDLDKFYNFARHLENIREEKWVLTFYQIEMFPNIKLSGQIHQLIVQLISDLQVARSEDAVHARIIEKLLERIDRELNAADSFPVEEISKMLVKVDTTYHCFIMGVQREALSEDLGYKRVASDIENSLREITRRSGGEVVFSGNLGSALHAVEEKEDIYYVLTYAPSSPERKGKVKIELPGNLDCRLFYDDNIRADYIGEYLKKKREQDPLVLLEGLDLQGRTLGMKISNFKIAGSGKERVGRLHVAIRIRDDQNQQLYNQGRVFAASESQVDMAVDFAFLKPGRYMFLVEVQDLLTGKTIMDILQAEAD
ncbi:MAG: hypothetical protein L6428_08985 [Candidatus Aminicenantes bacterium]|nr:hypothetical protein [Acidobacteriota bacterium]MCG2811577.1 hypothetical protein [Candidatus Aminicenantes bacterium]